jgi:hypothetical protein
VIRTRGLADNQEDNNRQGAAAAKWQVGDQNEDRPAILESPLVGRLARTSTCCRILPSRSKADDTACDGQHPEHPQGRHAVRCGGEDAADDDQQRGHDDGCLASEVVACRSNDHLSQDLAHQEGIGDLRLDMCCIDFGVLQRVKDVQHSPV